MRSSTTIVSISQPEISRAQDDFNFDISNLVNHRGFLGNRFLGFTGCGGADFFSGFFSACFFSAGIRRKSTCAQLADLQNTSTT